MPEDLGILEKFRLVVLAENSVMFGSRLLGQHGISFLLEVQAEGMKRFILVDVGQNTDTLMYNMKSLGIDPSIVDAIVLTHRHQDHTGGLSKVLKAIGKRDLPVIAHPDITRFQFTDKKLLRYSGMRLEDKERIEKAGGVLFLTRDPLKILPGLMTTGEVVRTTDFEKPEGFKTINEEGRVVYDALRDDIAVIALMKEGIVIITGCAHSGIVNIIKHSIKLAGVSKVVAVIGGLHLINASDERIAKTVSSLQELQVENIYAGHCTGFKAQVELYKAFSERFKPLSTGLHIEF